MSTCIRNQTKQPKSTLLHALVLWGLRSLMVSDGLKEVISVQAELGYTGYSVKAERGYFTMLLGSSVLLPAGNVSQWCQIHRNPLWTSGDKFSVSGHGKPLQFLKCCLPVSNYFLAFWCILEVSFNYLCLVCTRCMVEQKGSKFWHTGCPGNPLPFSCLTWTALSP